jgi:hypothetical protein
MNRITFANRIKKNTEFLTEHAQQFLKESKEYKYSIAWWCRQAGKSTVLSVSVRDSLLENPGTIAILVSNRFSSSQNLLNSLHLFTNESDIKIRTKNYIHFSNGSMAVCSTPSSLEKLKRLFVPDLIAIDEFDFIDKNRIKKIISECHIVKEGWFGNLMNSIFGKKKKITKYIFFSSENTSDNFKYLKSILPKHETFLSEVCDYTNCQKLVKRLELR